MKELPAILLKSNVIDGAFLQPDSADNAGAEQLLHHQEADQTGQTGSAIVVVRQTPRQRRWRTKPCHVVDQGAAGADQQETESVSETGSCALSTLNSGSERRQPMPIKDTR